MILPTPTRAACPASQRRTRFRRSAREVWLASQWSAIAAGTWEHPAAVAAREAEAARQQSLRGLTMAEWADA